LLGRAQNAVDEATVDRDAGLAAFEREVEVARVRRQIRRRETQLETRAEELPQSAVQVREAVDHRGREAFDAALGVDLSERPDLLPVDRPDQRRIDPQRTG